jgi:imidazolonepropionase-like amidohydrolase
MLTKAIVGGRLIDGTGSDPIEPGAVLVEDRQIKWAGDAEDAQIPEDAEVIDAGGKTIMPGLIDAHMHVGFHFQALKRLRDCLDRGTTTVAAVTGGPGAVRLREAIEGGLVDRCPRYVVGCVVGATCGHLRRTDANVAGATADGPWEVRKGVREMVQAGADFIKASASGGFQWELERVEWEDYTSEELAALVHEAHAKDRPVAVHAHSQPGLNHAIRAGCDMIHHGALIDDEALEGIAQQDLYYVPTLHITSQMSYEHPSRGPWMKERMKHAHPIHREGVRKAHEMGLKMAAGTDGGPGDVAHELMELVACGLSPMEAIVAGTHNSAEALGILEKTGTLEPGKEADIILVSGDPLEDVSVLYQRDNIVLAMRGGKVGVVDEEHKQYLHPRGE